MPHRKIIACGRCGKDMSVGVTTYKVRYCPECREARIIENIRQLAQKSGPFYETYLKNKNAYHASQSRGGAHRKRSL